jgi:hypothetical protein
MIQASISVAMIKDHLLRANKIFGIKKSSDKSNHFFYFSDFIVTAFKRII